MLALSSLSKSSRYVAILYAGIIFFTDGDLRRALRASPAARRMSWVSLDREPRAGRRRHLPPARRATTTPVAGLAHRHRRRWSSCRSRCSSAACAAWRWSRERPHGTPIVAADHVSKWYGQVIGLNDVTRQRCRRASPACSARTAPASRTFMKLITGQLKPSKGDGARCSASRSGGTRRSTSASGSAPSRTRSTSG